MSRLVAAGLLIGLLAPAAARADGYTFAYDFGSECG